MSDAINRGDHSPLPLDAKRVFDLVVAGTVGVLLLPVIAAVAVAVRVCLGGPVLFRQWRPGLHGQPFEMVKFRSMRDAVDRDGRPLPDHERLTRFGKLLRASSLDELPELWNVLRGEMSLVGPRPLLPQYLPLYTPDQARRHDVRPGVTGWAQVNGRNAVSWDRKFELDLEYVDSRSLMFDLRVLVMTVGKVLIPSGISQSGHATAAAFDAASSRRCVLFGSGGHAKVVIESLRRLGDYVEAIYDDDASRIGQTVAGVPVAGTIDDYIAGCQAGHRRRGLIAIGSAAARQAIAARVDCHWMTVVDPNAVVAADVQLGNGVYVAAGAVVQPSTTIGEHTIINTAASVDHDCRIAAFAHVAPGSTLAGGVQVGTGTLCGLGCRVLPGVAIGDDCTLGAGAVATADVADLATAVGVPARVIAGCSPHRLRIAG